MAYRSQLCGTCIHKNERCYAAPNSICSAYEEEEIKKVTVGNYLARLLTDSKYKEAAEFLHCEANHLCNFSENGEEFTCQYEANCSICWERFLNAAIKGEL